MTLYRLGQEYAESEQKLRERIEVLYKQCEGKSAEEKKKLQRRIWQLRIDAADCGRISRHLMNYYSEKGDDAR